MGAAVGAKCMRCCRPAARECKEVSSLAAAVAAIAPWRRLRERKEMGSLAAAVAPARSAVRECKDAVAGSFAGRSSTSHVDDFVSARQSRQASGLICRPQ